MPDTAHWWLIYGGLVAVLVLSILALVGLALHGIGSTCRAKYSQLRLRLEEYNRHQQARQRLGMPKPSLWHRIHRVLHRYNERVRDFFDLYQ